jgi:tRNA U55 pseudouridine synthase TruB
MECRPPRDIVEISGELSSGKELTVETIESFADHPLVVGQRYQEKDFSVAFANSLGWYSSGIVLGFIGKSAPKAIDFKNGQHLKVYEIKGKFGFGTDNFREDGKIIEKSGYKHVTHGLIGRVVSKIQAIQQTQMFKTIGVDIRSEDAYQMAAKGMIRPGVRKTQPVVYDIKLTDFDLPEFTLEVQCINEYEPFLCGLIDEIGHELKTSAFCTRLRLIRYGPFTLEHSLLFKHWTLENIIQNIKLCRPLLKPHLVTPLSPTLTDPNLMTDHEIFLETLKQKGIVIK